MRLYKTLLAGYLVFILFSAVVAFAAELTAPYKAVVIVPVVDAIAHPFLRLGAGDVNPQYASIPFSPHQPTSSCCRTHQLKKNEQVTVLTVLANEVECRTDAFYYEYASGERDSTFWVLKKNLIPLSAFVAKNIHIPAGITKKATPTTYNQGVLTLTAPWLDVATQELYSVGTRFVRCDKQDTPTHYAFYITDLMLQEKIAFVARAHARVSYPIDYTDSLAAFMKLLREWASLSVPVEIKKQHINKTYRMSQRASEKKAIAEQEVSVIQKPFVKEIIPYVYGGCSYRGRIPAKGFYLAKGTQCGEKSIFWQRCGTYKAPLDGFDCSNMILCAAQIVGMPYYFKNTYALLRGLKELKKDERLEEGDLVWYKGHVLVVSDVKKNLLIEASGYEAGYGKIQEISVDKVFEGIAHFGEVINAFHSGKSVRRLTSKGRRMPLAFKVKIVKLRSMWC